MSVISGQGLGDPALLKPAMPAIYAAQLLQLAARWRLSPKVLLEGTGLDERTLEDPDQRVPPFAFGQLVLRALELTREPGLGFYYGLHLKLPSHGSVGFAAMTSATLGDALSIAERYVGLRTSQLRFRHYIEGDQAVFELSDTLPAGVLRAFVTEALFTALVQIARTLLGRAITGMAEMAFAEPKYFQGFAHLIPGPVRFRQPASRLLFSVNLLDESLLMADAVAARQAVLLCEAELSKLDDVSTLLSSVRHQMRSRRAGFPTLTELARERHVSPRTLKRQLAAHGTSFQRILDELRRDCAVDLLESEAMTIEHIAERLGYSDASNFNRAFQRWLGMSPRAFREAHVRK